MTTRRMQVRMRKQGTEQQREKTGEQVNTNHSPSHQKYPLCSLDFLSSIGYVTTGSAAELSGGHL